MKFSSCCARFYQTTSTRGGLPQHGQADEHGVGRQAGQPRARASQPRSRASDTRGACPASHERHEPHRRSEPTRRALQPGTQTRERSSLVDNLTGLRGEAKPDQAFSVKQSASNTPSFTQICCTTGVKSTLLRRCRAIDRISRQTCSLSITGNQILHQLYASLTKSSQAHHAAQHYANWQTLSHPLKVHLPRNSLNQPALLNPAKTRQLIPKSTTEQHTRNVGRHTR